MMSSPESPFDTAEDQSRARPDGSAREAAHKLERVLETLDASTPGQARSVLAREAEDAPRRPRAVRGEAAAARLLLLLHATPLLGVAGAIALYWSSDGPRDVMFAVGMLLLLSGVTAFQQLRSRLVARLALPALREGVPRPQALQHAELAADKLIRDSFLLSRGEASHRSTQRACRNAETRPSRWPPISLS